MDARFDDAIAGFRDVADRLTHRPARRRGVFSPRWMRHRAALRDRRLKCWRRGRVEAVREASGGAWSRFGAKMAPT
jgi:hypothetical protein